MIYRHPCVTGVATFIEDLSLCLSELFDCKQTFYLLGDLNINISQANRQPYANHYLNKLLSYGAIQVITKPTRVTDTTSTNIELLRPKVKPISSLARIGQLDKYISP